MVVVCDFVWDILFFFCMNFEMFILKFPTISMKRSLEFMKPFWAVFTFE